jgi:hypothetical protein
MITFGLVGAGRFGSRVRNVLEDESFIDLKWVSNSETDTESLTDVDWVYICSPVECHFENAIEFMTKGSSVILEKPPTLRVSSIKYLLQKASEYGVEIYFSMTYLFDSQVSKIKKPSSFIWHKSIEHPTEDSALTALLFHHLYIFLDGNSNEINKLKIQNKNFRSPEEFSFEFWGEEKKLAGFEYLRKPKISLNHEINDIKIKSGKPYTLSKMLRYVTGKDSTESNHLLALNAMYLLEKVRREIFPKKAVIGAGIFGCSSAIALSKKGYMVDLFERNNEIMQEASSINQYRIHRGYHYPRSDETVEQCAKSHKSFEKCFYTALVKRTSHKKSYYAIASADSKVSPNEYIKFLKSHNLKHTRDDIGLTNVDLTVAVEERLYDPHVLKKLISNRLDSLGVNLKLGEFATRDDLALYSGGAIATYASQGDWDDSVIDYQFELCEKPIVLLPPRYKGLSVVIMDGPFMCVDPYADSDFHVMGNVVHAIHETSFGQTPLVPSGYEKLLNKGCISPPKEFTNFDLFVESATAFFPEINNAKHIGSMYTIRTVESNRDHDDARLSNIKKLESNFLKVFSGKVCTSHEISNNVTQIISGLDS